MTLTVEDINSRLAAGLTKEDCAEFISESGFSGKEKALLFMTVWNLPDATFEKLAVFAGDILPDFIKRDLPTVEKKLAAAGLPGPIVNMFMNYVNSIK
jgi:hypothetical protein